MIQAAITVVFTLCLNCFDIVHSVQCLNENGDTVGWWFVYKHNDGMNYFYFDESSNDEKLILSTNSDFSNKHSSIGSTLEQVMS